MVMKKYFNTLLLALIISTGSLFAQDSLAYDYPKIYAFCLDANVKPVLSLIENDSTQKLSAKDAKFKTDFLNRFKFTKDKSVYTEEKASDINKLLSVFRSYWRKSLLDAAKSHDLELITDIKDFLTTEYPPVKGIVLNDDSLSTYVKRYLSNKGLHTTDGIGKTGRLIDLLVWENEKDTTFTFILRKEKISARVILMKNFRTLGWEEYATLGRYYPGGWTTNNALYCVEQAYDLKSETFLISYLAHESRHFADYKLFPNLSSPDLEYRAKLTELSLARKMLYKLIAFFISNANYNSDNGHSIANYSAIRDLSRLLFHVEFEKDLNQWNKISIKKINSTAYKILQTNTKLLKQKGPKVDRFIKN